MPFDGKNFTQTDSEVVTVLKKARALIDSPEKWCRGDQGINATDPHCALGAIHHAAFGKVVGCDRSKRYWTPLFEAIGKPPHDFNEAWALAEWNNSHSHAEVMEAFDRAIILAGGMP